MADVTINAKDGGSFSAYLATPSGGSGPAVVVIQEIFGVNKVMRDICDGMAKQGYTAICPDLFWRQEPGIQITDKSEEEWQKAFSLYQGFDEAKGVEDLAATIDFIRGHDANSDGKVGTMGFCLGGKLAYLCGTRTDAEANVGYYGVGIEAALDEADKITRPMLLHIAEEDGFCPKEAQEKIHAALDGHSNVTIHDYPGVDHAFAREGGEHYDADAANVANERTHQFLNAYLR
jgi:carboxymethylenebutenolidase